MGHRWLVGAIALGMISIGNSERAVARPAEVFTPYLDKIRQELPSSYAMRLPSEILLGGPGLSPDELKQLIVRIIPTSSPPRLTISLFTCASGPYPCLIGSFAVESTTSTNAEHELHRHMKNGDPILLADHIQGYLREGQKQNPPSDFSSVMWTQNNMVYTVSFLATERQNILYMAHSMANTPLILSVQAPTAQQ